MGRASPDRRQYLHGVLCIDAVEISTNGGHYVALDMQPSPYPLGGEPDGGRRGRSPAGRLRHRRASGFATSELAWTDWDAAFDGSSGSALTANGGTNRVSSRSAAVRLLVAAWSRTGVGSRPARRNVEAVGQSDPASPHRCARGCGRPWRDRTGHGRRREARPALGTIPSYEASFRSF